MQEKSAELAVALDSADTLPCLVLRSRVMSDRGSNLKSAYELALERLEEKGIEPPRPEALSDELKQQMAEVRSKAEAELARVEILHRDSSHAIDPLQQAEAEANYRRDRQRIEDDRDRKLARLRKESS